MKLILIIIGLLVVLFILHVPFLTYFSKFTLTTKLKSYPSLDENNISTEKYDLIKVFNGVHYNTWFDNEKKTFIISMQLKKEVENNPNFKVNGQYCIEIDSNGNVINAHMSDSNTYDFYDQNKKYSKVNYQSHKDTKPFKLKHFERMKFSWPYFYYYFPVVLFNWKGIGYMELNHEGDKIQFQLPLNYFSRFFYFDGKYDEQLYYLSGKDYDSNISFLIVTERSSTRSSVTGEKHRKGFGFYMIRKK